MLRSETTKHLAVCKREIPFGFAQDMLRSLLSLRTTLTDGTPRLHTLCHAEGVWRPKHLSVCKREILHSRWSFRMTLGDGIPRPHTLCHAEE